MGQVLGCQDERSDRKSSTIAILLARNFPLVLLLQNLSYGMIKNYALSQKIVAKLSAIRLE